MGWRGQQLDKQQARWVKKAEKLTRGGTKPFVVFTTPYDRLATLMITAMDEIGYELDQSNSKGLLGGKQRMTFRKREVAV